MSNALEGGNEDLQIFTALSYLSFQGLSSPGHFMTATPT